MKNTLKGPLGDLPFWAIPGNETETFVGFDDAVAWQQERGLPVTRPSYHSPQGTCTVCGRPLGVRGGVCGNACNDRRAKANAQAAEARSAGYSARGRA